MPSSPRARARVLVLALGAAALTACSSSGAAELSTAPSPTPNGKHYVYADGSVERTDWPDVCFPVTADSAAAVIGTAVTTKAFHRRCYYIPGNDAFPTLTVTILGIGNDQQDTFNSVRDQNANRSPRRVDGVGRAAVTYTLSVSPTMVMDVLTDQGAFELALRSPVGNKVSSGRGLDMLSAVGRVLAKEFSD
ncbi:hypothetical protein [uncultured Jatrophihabitans sp.]|uniref:hypothetical protein n=1 Tax=uncultured Jatrophihabitans sp. TaxID=1610747 RepID=UPI0035CAAC4E